MVNNFMEILFKKYFVDGTNLNDIDSTTSTNQSVLLTSALEAGISEGIVQAYQNIDKSSKASLLRGIEAKDNSAKQQRVNGVPFFIIENQNVDNSSKRKHLMFSGGQPVDAMTEYLEEAYKEE